MQLPSPHGPQRKCLTAPGRPTLCPSRKDCDKDRKGPLDTAWCQRAVAVPSSLRWAGHDFVARTVRLEDSGAVPSGFQLCLSLQEASEWAERGCWLEDGCAISGATVKERGQCGNPASTQTLHQVAKEAAGSRRQGLWAH